MTAGPITSQWERVRLRALKLGPVGLLNVALRKAKWQATRRWRRLRAYLTDTQVSQEVLVRALHVDQRALPEAVTRIRRALRTRLPCGPDDAEAIVAALNQSAPEVITSIVEAADRVCDHVFDLLGSGRVALGPRIDWHRDFKSGYRWDPRLFYTEVPHGHIPGVDIKVPWELSRGHHLLVLAQAYLLTKNERYAREIVSQIKDWLETNPPQFGVNWACPMDAAIRAVNWLWAACLVVDSPIADTEFFLELLAGFLAHGRYLMANLEIRADGITTNHYLANVVGLLYLGLCLPELPEAANWRAFAIRALVKEMDHQVLPDGAHYESSIPYHRLVSEMFLSATLLGRVHKVELGSAFLARLERMVGFVYAYTKPNGLAPQLGDADDGRLHSLCGYGTADPRDHRHILALGALPFEREDWWAATGPAWVEALWFGSHKTKRWARPPVGLPPLRESIAFPDAGLYLMREGQDYVLLNCGPVGTQGLGTHKHNDLLALEVHLRGEDILVDPGSFLYTPDPEARNALRGTAVHNTVMVDGYEQNRFVRNQLFCLHPDAHPRVLAWEAGTTRDCIVAEHNGYARLADPVVHRRKVTFEHATGQIEVFDYFMDPTGDYGTHELLWNFTFAPGCSIEAVSDGWMIRTARQCVHFAAPCRDPNGDTLKVESNIEQGWMSPRYGIHKKTPVLRWRWQGRAPISVRFAIAVSDAESVNG